MYHYRVLVLVSQPLLVAGRRIDALLVPFTIRSEGRLGRPPVVFRFGRHRSCATISCHFGAAPNQSLRCLVARILGTPGLGRRRLTRPVRSIANTRIIFTGEHKPCWRTAGEHKLHLMCSPLFPRKLSFLEAPVDDIPLSATASKVERQRVEVAACRFRPCKCKTWFCSFVSDLRCSPSTREGCWINRRKRLCVLMMLTSQEALIFLQRLACVFALPGLAPDAQNPRTRNQE